MADRYMVSEDEVKQALNIKSFRNLSKDKVMEFVSQIPYMDKDVAISIIQQFPKFADTSMQIIDRLNNICDESIKSNEYSQRSYYDACKETLDACKLLVADPDICAADKIKVADMMVRVTDKMAAKDTENKKFLSDNIKNFAVACLPVLIMLGAVLGVSIKGHNIPKKS